MQLTSVPGGVLRLLVFGPTRQLTEAAGPRSQLGVMSVRRAQTLDIDRAAHLLVFNGGIVFFVGILAGFPYGVMRARGGAAADLDDWRIAHVQSLQNGFLLLVVAACMSYTDLSESLRAVMVYLLITGAYTDTAAWTIRPITGHKGLLPTAHVLNLAVFGLFGITVVGQVAGFLLFIFGAWRGLG